MHERHTKILATVGPSCNSPEILSKLVFAGVNGFRLNFSHGSHEAHAEVIKHIRAIEAKLGQPITILQDLQGPKIRIGELEKPQILTRGDTFILDNNPAPGDKTRVHLPHTEILEILDKDEIIFINDGIIRLKVTEKYADKVVCEVLSGGTVSSRKGVNLPNVDLPVSAITKKDWEDLDFGLSQGVDWVAISFIQHPDDILQVRKKVGDKVSLMAKIEKPNAVARIDAIIKVSDAIMVARGDLGVELPLADVPSIQKKLIRKCREAGKPVVVATQMLESMIHNPVPTRAEVSDVANATYEGADTLMLSAETAAGAHPIKVVEVMGDTITRVENSSAWQPLIDARHPAPTPSTQDAITNAAYKMSEVLNTVAIVTFTESGSTSVRMSRQRPKLPIVVVTPHEKTARKLSLTWGLHCRIDKSPASIEEMEHFSLKALREEGLWKKGGHIILTAGIPFGEPGATNMIRVVSMDEELDT